jgi:hypothetical protein
VDGTPAPAPAATVEVEVAAVADAAATEGGASGLFAGRISGLNFPAWDGGFFGGILLILLLLVCD